MARALPLEPGLGARLRRAAAIVRRIVGAPDYDAYLRHAREHHPECEPLTGGMRAAYPYIDRLVSGHDVASLEALGTVLGGIERRHAA